jgi:phospholipase/carboxylesterase
MRRETIGQLTVWATGGDDDRGGGDGPAVVLCHGFGAPGDDLVPLAEVLTAPPRTRFFFPEAPLALPAPYGDARAWWMIDLLRLESSYAAGRGIDLAAEVPPGLTEAREQLVSTLEAIRARAPAAAMVLGGFSQGAMLATDVAARSEVPLAGLVLLSGTLIAEKEWVPLLPRRRGLEVFQSHGSADPLLPYAGATRLRDRLIEAGCEVRFVPFPGGHEIPRSVLALLPQFLAETLEG